MRKKKYKKAEELSGSQLAIAFRRFRRNRAGLIGLTLTLFIFFLAIFADYIAPFDPLEPLALETNYSPFYQPPGTYKGAIYYDQMSRINIQDGGFETAFGFSLWTYNNWNRVNLTEQGINSSSGSWAVRCGTVENYLSYDISSGEDLFFNELEFDTYLDGTNSTTLTIIISYGANKQDEETSISINLNNTWRHQVIELSARNPEEIIFTKGDGSDILLDNIKLIGGIYFSHVHLMGTNYRSQDLFSKIIHGTRVSLIISIGAIIISLILGIPLGLISGYYRGRTDEVIMRMTDIFLTLPFYFTMILVIVLIQGTQWVDNLINRLGIGTQVILIAVTFGLGIFGWMGITRLIRANILQIREMDYVEAARALGASDRRIMIVHILPNVLAPVIVVVTLALAVNILAEAGLAFLGFTDESLASWGRELNDGFEIAAVAWWPVFFPAILIVIAVMAFNLLGDGLRDSFDPRLR